MVALLHQPIARLPLIAFVIACFSTSGAGSPGQTPQAPGSGTGRVIVTVSLEGVRVPAVTVSLRSTDGNVVIGQTTTDNIGQVAFPDVAPGRYVVLATRDGFADTETAPFDVNAGENEQVLVETRLTFVRESVDVIVPANSPTESLQ